MSRRTLRRDRLSTACERPETHRSMEYGISGCHVQNVERISVGNVADLHRRGGKERARSGAFTWGGAHYHVPRAEEAERLARALETQMQPQGRVDFVHAPLRDATHAISETFNSDRADLFGLSFRVSPQAAITGRQPDLEGIYATNVAGHWYDRNHAAVRRCRALVRRVIAHDDCGPLESCLGTNRAAEVDHPNVAPPHPYRGSHGVRPSREDRSHILSSSSSHSAHAEA